ncbi:hypothetical protein GGF37_001918, partial [Kickxella alabastrina]
KSNVAANPALKQNKTTNASSASHTTRTNAKTGLIKTKPAQAPVATKQALTKAETAHASQPSEAMVESETLRCKLAVFESKLTEKDVSIANLKVKLGRAEKDNAKLQIRLGSIESMLRVQRQNVKTLDANVRKAESKLKEACTDFEKQRQIIVELHKHRKPVFCSGSLYVQRQNVKTLYDQVCKVESELNVARADAEAKQMLTIKLCNKVKTVQARAKAQQPAGNAPRAGYFETIRTLLAKVVGISHANKPDTVEPSAPFLALKEIADSLDEIIHRGRQAQTNHI